jgi:hypothetical protein
MNPLEREHTVTEIEKLLHAARVHTIGGHDGGSARSSDGRLEIKLVATVIPP